MKFLLLILTLSFSASYVGFSQIALNIPFQNEMEKDDFQQGSYDIFIRGRTSELLDFIKEKNITHKYNTNEWIAINIKGDQLQKLLILSALEEIYWANDKGFLLNDKMLGNANVLGLQEIGIYDSLLNGENVILGFIDSGLDYSHPDFVNEDGSSRILYFWDQKDPIDSSEIFLDYGYGKLISQDTLNEWLDIDYEIILDPNSEYGHGTTVVGTACSNGRALLEQIEDDILEYDLHGIAPRSDIIMVASNFNHNNWLASVADGVHFMLAKAEELNLPIVINLSVGTYTGSHDGFDPVGTMINEWFSDNHASRSLVCAGGNSRTLRYHLGYDSNADSSFSIFSSFNGLPEFGRMSYFEAWLDSIDLTTFATSIGIYDQASGDFEDVSTNYNSITENIGNTLIDTLWQNDSTILGIVKRFMVYQGEQVNFQVQVDHLLSNNFNTVLHTVGDGRLDCWSAQWFSNSDILGAESLPLAISSNDKFEHPDSLMQIVSSFSCAENVITVANYKNRVDYQDVNNVTQSFSGQTGELAMHSSRGPTRDGRIKPEITASGELILSSGPFNYLDILLAAAPHKVALGGWHMRNGGTSMASPIVAGIAALYLQRCPNAKPSTIKDAILESGYQDIFTGILANNSWGFGKVDALASLNHSIEEIIIEESNSGCSQNLTTLNVSESYYNIQWNTGDTTNSICVDAGVYWLSALDENACLQRSENIVVIADNVIEQLHDEISVYPNPSNGIFKVSGIYKKADLKIINVLGQEQVFRVDSFAEGIEIEIQNVEDGLYFLILKERESYIEFLISN